MEKNNKVDMLHGSLFDKIILFSLPVAFTGILQQLFNSADIAVVGRFAGKQALAAVGSTAPIINVIINLFTGLSLGSNVLLGNLLGQGASKAKDTNEALHTVISLSLISGVLLLFVGFFLSPCILKLVSPPQEVFNLSDCYLKIYFLGMPFIMLYNFASASLRSKGDSKRPLYVLIISGIVNVILNLILVIIFSMGVQGVAIATVISNVISSILVLFFLTRQTDCMKLDIKHLHLKANYVATIAKIGLPAGLQSTLFSLSNVFIQGAINSLGSSAMAGSAAAVNYEFFTYFIIAGFIQATVSFTSQNYGARNLKRCKQVLIRCMILATVASFILCSIFVYFNKAFISIYTVDSEAFPYAVMRLCTVERLGFVPAIYEMLAAFLRACGYSLLPALIVLVCTCFFRIIWVFTVFGLFHDFSTLMLAQPISWIITTIFMTIAFFIILKKITRETL